MSHAEEWALRCYHESQMHEANSFITLTYSDKYLPDDYSVDVRTWQLFMKRLRELVPTKLRFFACGEYGDETLRPHYHALIFGWDFHDDRKLFKVERGSNLYESPTLSKAWTFGSALLGGVTYKSAAYCARYVVKKVGGPKAADHYIRVHPLTSELVRVKPEFATQSRRDGLGTTWFNKYKSDAFPSDFLVADGTMHRVPRFYDRKLAEAELEDLKRKRKRKALPHKSNNTPERLQVRQQVALSRESLLKRGLK